MVGQNRLAVVAYHQLSVAHERLASVNLAFPDCTPRPQVIRELLDVNSFVIVVEHDLAVLDYLSDFICCLYGKPGAYGVVTLPFGVR